MFPGMSPTVGLICARARRKVRAIYILAWACAEYTDFQMDMPIEFVPGSCSTSCLKQGRWWTRVARRR